MFKKNRHKFLFSKTYKAIVFKLFAQSLFFFITTFALFSADNLEKYYRGIEKFKKHEYTSARKEFEEFVKEHPYEIEVKKSWYYMVRTLVAEKKWHDAITRINITLERYPLHEDRVELKVLLGRCLYKVNAHARAEKILRGTASTVKDDALRYLLDKTLGLIYYDARKFGEAQKYLESAVRLSKKLNEKDKELFDIYVALAKVASLDTSKTADAIRYYAEAISIGEKDSKKDVNVLKLEMRKLAIRRVDSKNGLKDDNIADIRVDGDDVYIATWGAGLFRFVRSSEKIERINVPSAQLRGLYVDFDDIYVASFDGVFRVSKKSGEVAVLKDEAGELKLGQKTLKDDRYIYFTTLTRGLIQYDTVKKKVVAFGKDSWVGSNQVYALDVDLSYIVVGTLDHGVIIYNKETKETVSIGPSETGLKSANIKAVLLDGRYVYIGAHNDGVYVYDIHAKKLTKLSMEIPFPSAFAKRENEIFIGTSGQGIRVLNRNNNSVTKLRAIEGLSSDEIQIIRVEGDFLWIGFLEKGIDVLYLPEAL
ncbi:MAG: hypothetical protein LDLANPLL_02023 [Turneriella sp.]|nr:hypothetical protein [Turneriella sp.]